MRRSCRLRQALAVLLGKWVEAIDCQFNPLARAVVRERSLFGDQVREGRAVVLRRGGGVEGGWEADRMDIVIVV